MPFSEIPPKPLKLRDDGVRVLRTFPDLTWVHVPPPAPCQGLSDLGELGRFEGMMLSFGDDGDGAALLLCLPPDAAADFPEVLFTRDVAHELEHAALAVKPGYLLGSNFMRVQPGRGGRLCLTLSPVA